MSPEFSAAVDPVFTYILSIMEEIEAGKSQLPDHISSHVSETCSMVLKRV